tara:strand:- start:948 stop:2540 length:1593 start_codon:yes stop_codon:yes gene_type:complete
MSGFVEPKSLVNMTFYELKQYKKDNYVESFLNDSMFSFNQNVIINPNSNNRWIEDYVDPNELFNLKIDTMKDFLTNYTNSNLINNLFKKFFVNDEKEDLINPVKLKDNYNKIKNMDTTTDGKSRIMKTIINLMEKDDAWEDFYDRYSIRSLYKDLDEYIERYNKPKSLIVMSDNIIKTRIYEIDQGDQPSCVKLLPDYKNPSPPISQSNSQETELTLSTAGFDSLAPDQQDAIMTELTRLTNENEEVNKLQISIINTIRNFFFKIINLVEIVCKDSIEEFKYDDSEQFKYNFTEAGVLDRSEVLEGEKRKYISISFLEYFLNKTFETKGIKSLMAKQNKIEKKLILETFGSLKNKRTGLFEKSEELERKRDELDEIKFTIIYSIRYFEDILKSNLRNLYITLAYNQEQTKPSSVDQYEYYQVIQKIIKIKFDDMIEEIVEDRILCNPAIPIPLPAINRSRAPSRDRSSSRDRSRSRDKDPLPQISSEQVTQKKKVGRPRKTERGGKKNKTQNKKRNNLKKTRKLKKKSNH